jgi:hypothetical protein
LTDSQTNKQLKVLLKNHYKGWRNFKHRGVIEKIRETFKEQRDFQNAKNRGGVDYQID